MKLLFTFLILIDPLLNWSQCAMCRTQIKNNVSHGDTELATGLNTGILFLFFTPYIVVGIIMLLWFRYSKSNERKIGIEA